ncbi:MAG: 23S rRNA (guanosine(2251)-2'-O)-methyltransferase RlmB [Deltaproteobacteria bacterium]|nr:MAG: 23S rRNA (guanosine(2251)-2'-O)-methyltransferase RlmB [Deltaproteobacteria bacterium]
MPDRIGGFHAVRAALEAGSRKSLRLLLANEGRNSRLEQIRELAVRAGVAVQTLPRNELDRLAAGLKHQDVLLELEPFAYADFEGLLHREGDLFFLLLDGITDPHNLGAIARSAEAAGCTALVLPKDRSCPVTPVAERTSAGALNHLPVCQVTNLARAIDQLKERQVWVYGLAGEADANDLFGTNLTGPVALVVGAEGTGLRPNVRRHCDALISIPMTGQVESLNASVAAGIALFEVVRQRRHQAHHA